MRLFAVRALIATHLVLAQQSGQSELPNFFFDSANFVTKRFMLAQMFRARWNGVWRNKLRRVAFVL